MKIEGKGRGDGPGDDARELRKARSLSQDDVAAALTVNQFAVAKLEKRGDMHVSNLLSNLRGIIEALGSTLEITARLRQDDRGLQ